MPRSNGAAGRSPAGAPPAAPAEAPAYTVEGRTYPYLRQFSNEQKDPTEDEMTLYFVNGGDIPYVALTEYMAFLSGLIRDLERGDVAYEIMRVDDEEAGGFAVTRSDNGSMLLIDPANDQLFFDNLNAFTMAAGTKAMVSTLSMPDAEVLDPLDSARSHTEAPDGNDESPAQAVPDAAAVAEESPEEWNIETMPPEDSEYPDVYDPTVQYDSPREIPHN